MDFSKTYETPFRAYIQNRVQTLENKLEEVAKSRSNSDVTSLEKQIDDESKKFMDDVKTRLNQIREQIKSHRPTNQQASDYTIRMEQYRQFVQSSTNGVDQITTWITSLFDKILSVLKSIIQWILDNKQTIIDIIKQIREAFIFIRTFY